MATPPPASGGTKKNQNQIKKHGLCSCARMAVLTIEEVLCEVLNRKSVIVPGVSYDVRGRPGLLQHFRKTLDERKYRVYSVHVTRLVIW